MVSRIPSLLVQIGACRPAYTRAVQSCFEERKSLSSSPARRVPYYITFFLYLSFTLRVQRGILFWSTGYISLHRYLDLLIVYGVPFLHSAIFSLALALLLSLFLSLPPSLSIYLSISTPGFQAALKDLPLRTISTPLSVVAHKACPPFQLSGCLSINYQFFSRRVIFNLPRQPFTFSCSRCGCLVTLSTPSTPPEPKSPLGHQQANTRHKKSDDPLTLLYGILYRRVHPRTYKGIISISDRSPPWKHSFLLGFRWMVF